MIESAYGHVDHKGPDYALLNIKAQFTRYGAKHWLLCIARCGKNELICKVSHSTWTTHHLVGTFTQEHRKLPYNGRPMAHLAQHS